MEVSGVVSRQVPCFSSGAGIDSRSSKPSFPSELRVRGSRDFGVSLRTGRSGGHVSVNSGFCDDGHVQYYCVGRPRCGGGKKEKEIKKKLKLLKALSKDLSASSRMAFGLESKEGLIPQVQGQLIAEGAEILLKQLEELRVEEKELKKKRKEEKAKLKAAKMKTMGSESSSSSSSESSDSECGEVIDMNRLRGEVPAQPMLDDLQPVTHQEGALLTQLSSLTTHQENTTVEHGIEIRSLQNEEEKCFTGTSTSCSNSGSIGHNDACSSSVMEVPAMRVEVCMGNKCKKSGGGALLEEFERVMGVEGSVVGCKCMGKCKNGPNVRILNSVDGIQSEGIVEDSVRNPTNPLYIGVGLEDVSLIVAGLLGEDRKDLGLVSCSLEKPLY